MSGSWNPLRTVKAATHPAVAPCLNLHRTAVDAETATETAVSRATIIRIPFRATVSRLIYRTMICHFNTEGLNRQWLLNKEKAETTTRDRLAAAAATSVVKYASSL
ncbi:hypothetical protein D3C73_1464070 [compost metagenome]